MADDNSQDVMDDDVPLSEEPSDALLSTMESAHDAAKPSRKPPPKVHTPGPPAGSTDPPTIPGGHKSHDQVGPESTEEIGDDEIIEEEPTHSKPPKPPPPRSAMTSSPPRVVSSAPPFKRQSPGQIRSTVPTMPDGTLPVGSQPPMSRPLPPPPRSGMASRPPATGGVSDPPHAMAHSSGRPPSRPPSRPPPRRSSRPPGSSLDYDPVAIKSSPPPNIPGPEAFGDPLDEPTLVATPSSNGGAITGPPRPPSRPPPNHAADAAPPSDAGEDEMDLAKTQKLERSDRVIGAEIAAAQAQAEALAKAADKPPSIPAMAQSPSKRKKDSGTKRRKGRKPKRRTVKIPDDNVPATPIPPAVADQLEADDSQETAALDEWTPSPSDVSGEYGPLGEPLHHEPAAEAFSVERERAEATPEAAEAASGEQDQTPTPPLDGGQSLGVLSSLDDEIEQAIDSSEFDARPTIPHAPDGVLERGGDFFGEHIEVPEAEADEEPVPTRESAPVIDNAAIMMLRPIEVVSDLPAVAPIEPEEIEPESLRDPLPPPTGRRPLPPPRTLEQPLEQIEEVIPDRMSVPAVTPDGRPLPPPRSAGAIGVADETGQQAAISAEDLHRLSGPPTSTDGLSEAEAELALAEARAREAEAKALALEAKARAAQAAAAAARKKSERPKKRPWWAEMFEDDLVRTLDNPRKRDVEKEATFIENTLRLDKGARVLDLACGTGVHAVELSARGYQVVGVDLSTTMLELAKNYNQQRGTAVSFIQGDMRQLNLEGVFDAIYCWSASFGFFDDPTNAKVLERVARALRPGGTFALDVPNRDYIAPRSPSMAWFEKPGCVCMDEMKFDFYSSRMTTKRMVLFEQGKSREIETNMRLYTLHELGRLLQKVGFRVIEVSGHRAHRGAYFGSQSPRIIITSRRPPDDAPTVPSPPAE